MERMHQLYKEVSVPQLTAASSRKNQFSVPKIEKTVISSGIGKFKDDSKLIELVVSELKAITGQLPKITRAKKAISAFKLRENEVIGLMVTLRGERMWSFLDKLVNVVLPRLRDFRGIGSDSFDDRGSLTLGFRDTTIFSEIDVNKSDRQKGLAVTIVTTSRDSQEAKSLLKSLGFPFQKD